MEFCKCNLLIPWYWFYKELIFRKMLFEYDLIGKSVSNENMFHFSSAPLWSCFVLLFCSVSLLNSLSLYVSQSLRRFWLLFVVLALVRMPGKRERRRNNLFKDSWLSDDRFSSWLQKESPTSAKCNLCGTVIDINNMGVSSLTSHKKYKKHQLKESGMSTATVSFFAAKSVPGTSSTT